MKGKKKKKHLHTNYIRTKYINPLSTTSQTKKKKIFFNKRKMGRNDDQVGFSTWTLLQ